jgi:hypothetical protein
METLQRWPKHWSDPVITAFCDGSCRERSHHPAEQSAKRASSSTWKPGLDHGKDEIIELGMVKFDYLPDEVPLHVRDVRVIAAVALEFVEDLQESYFFKESLSWSRVTSGRFSVRQYPEGFSYDSTAPSVFASPPQLSLILVLLNSEVIECLLSALSPTVDYRITNINDERNRFFDQNGSR